ncbi:MAG TPA: hypothetical protein VNA20_18970 [Frankiaceae bacterium]|nr:hypothetical protein [Frankiaceae bacterium]
MTKRIAGLVIAAATAASFALPAAPATAAGECWSWVTTPAECARELVSQLTPGVSCVRIGHTEVCPPPAS